MRFDSPDRTKLITLGAVVAALSLVGASHAQAAHADVPAPPPVVVTAASA